MLADGGPRRPGGLLLLAMSMMICGGMFLLIVCLTLLDPSTIVAVGFAQRFVLMAIVIALLIGSGIGLWKGTYWGWVSALHLV